MAVSGEPGPLGSAVDDLLRAALAKTLGAGEGGASMHVAFLMFITHAMLGLLCCVAVFLTSKLLSPIVFRSVLSKLAPFEQKIWHTNMVTFFPTFAVTYFALPAILDHAGARYSFVEPASANTLKACGMSLGYMTWDLGVLIFDARDQMRAYGGVLPYILFLFHHTLSIVAWPYAVCAGRCVYFVNFFLVSEVTNFNMSLRWFLLTAKKESGSLYMVNGLLWIPLFFAVRVAVIPRLVDEYWNGDWAQLGPVETMTARAMLPIPVMLNVYWMGLIASGALKFLKTGSTEEAPAGLEKKGN
jgi:hypothetical protein